MALSVLLAAILDFCVIVDQVLEHKMPQNKNVILNLKVKFVCRMCTQT